MVGGQRPPKDQQPDPTKIKLPIQLAAQIAIAVIGLATTVLMQRSKSAEVTTVVIALAVLSLGQVFSNLKDLPPNARAPLVFNVFRGLCIAWIIAGVLQIIPPFATPTPTPTPTPPSAGESTLRVLGGKLSDLRGVYQNLPHSVSKASELNRDAEQVAEKIEEINDEELGLNMQIFKYESLAYAYGIVAGSEMIAGKEFSSYNKSKALDDLLVACEKLKTRIDEAHRRQPVDDKLQKLRSWLVDDAADQRLLRLTAVGLCFRSQVNPQPEDRANVRKLLKKMSASYIAREHPELSYELEPCLSGK